MAANIYIDYFSPYPESESGGIVYDNDYVIDGCTYYIPGRTSLKYDKAPKKIEMFDIVLEKNSARLCVVWYAAHVSSTVLCSKDAYSTKMAC